MTASMIEMTTEIVASYLDANKVAVGDLPGLIKAVHGSLVSADKPSTPEAPANQQATSAQIRKSIKLDGLISFEDGKTYKTLKRHLMSYGLTFAAYKAKWGLPADYPSTSPEYSARRSAMAKSIGLGSNRRKPAPASTKKAGRSKKST